jgi:general L-amino acid transport system ATP-binding protein
MSDETRDEDIIVCRDVHKWFGDFQALRGISVTIKRGEVVVICGPSGSGKSTFIRTINRLEEHQRGDIIVDGIELTNDIRNIAAIRQEIGMVFQQFNLFPHLTVMNNVSLAPIWVRKWPKPKAEEITMQLLERVGIPEQAHKYPGQLSGGQQQRVAIARAIVRQPRLFLFDEPLSNLDAKLRTQTRVEIKRLLHRFGITAIYVTHDQVEATTLGDQIAVMRVGRIEQVGTYHELRQTPANAFVAGFLGSPPMNLLTGGTVGDGELHLEGVVVPLPDAVKAHVHTGQAVTLGVRPEVACLVAGNTSPSPDGVYLRGAAETIEPDFARRTQLVYTRTGALFYAVTGPLDTTLNVGDEVEVVFPTDQLHFFDGESGRRIG